MMINAQINIHSISAKGPPLLIAVKDVHNFEIQAEEPSLCAQDVQMPSSFYSNITSALLFQAESTETSVK